ncbi:Cell wall-binding protein YocH, partial [Bienertia sinuspersici]
MVAREESEDEDLDSNEEKMPTLKTRHTVQSLMSLIEGLLNSQEEKLQAIRDMGFGGFINLDMPRNTPYFFATLVENLEISGMCILCDRNRSMSIEPIDVHLVYRVPIGGKVIKDAKLEDDEFNEMVIKFKQYHNGKIPSLKALSERLVDEETPFDDDWKISFLVLALNSCIKHVINTQPFLSLIKWTEYWQEDKSRFFCGPPPFLMICYFDRLQRHTISQPREFPLLKVWNSDLIKKRIELEVKLGFGHGFLLERIQPPEVLEVQQPKPMETEEEEEEEEMEQQKQQQQQDTEEEEEEKMKKQQQEQHKNQNNNNKIKQNRKSNKNNLNLQECTQMLTEATKRIENDSMHLSNVLKMGERFHTIPLDQENTLYNVSAMWSRCSGYKMPDAFPGNHPLHKVDGASLLSQDNELFASDWFGEVVDNIVKNAGFQRNSDEQTPQNMPRQARQMTPPPFNPLIFMDTTPTSMQTESEKEACDLSLKL